MKVTLQEAIDRAPMMVWHDRRLTDAQIGVGRFDAALSTALHQGMYVETNDDHFVWLDHFRPVIIARAKGYTS